MDCDSSANVSDAKSDVSIRIVDSVTGDDKSDEFSMELVMPEGEECPSSCSD